MYVPSRMSPKSIKNRNSNIIFYTKYLPFNGIFFRYCPRYLSVIMTVWAWYFASVILKTFINIISGLSTKYIKRFNLNTLIFAEFLPNSSIFYWNSSRKVSSVRIRYFSFKIFKAFFKIISSSFLKAIEGIYNDIVFITKGSSLFKPSCKSFG